MPSATANRPSAAVDAQRVLVAGAHRSGVGVAGRAHPHCAVAAAPGPRSRSPHEITGDSAPGDNPSAGIGWRILRAGDQRAPPAGAGSRVGAARAWPRLGRRRAPRAAAAIARGQAAGRARHPRRAGRGVADAGRAGSRRDGARPAARSDPRSAADGAAGHAVAAARPGRARPRRAVAGDRAARPGAEARRGGPRLARHRAGALRARLLLPQGRRSRDRPRAPDRGGRGAARRRRSSGTWPRCIRCRG